MGGKEAVELPRRLNRFMIRSRRRVGDGSFGPVIEALMLPMLDPGHDLPLGARSSLACR